MSLLCVALSPAVDVTYVLDELTPGRIHRPREVLRVAGGKGFNVARAARLLGAGVTAAGIVGGHAGRWLADALRADGVAARLVPGHAESRTCVSILDATAGALSEVYEPAAPVRDDEWDALVEVVARHDGDWVTLSGSLPAGAPVDAVPRLVRAARARGARVALDTHGPALATGLDEAHLVKVNAAEAAELLGHGPDADAATPATGILARARAAALVVVTAGPAGAVAAAPDGGPPTGGAPVADPERPPAAGPAGPGAPAAPRSRLIRAAPAYTVEGAYPVGSGDSFLAGLVTELARSGDVGAALRTAVATGSANATVPGPGIFDPAVVARLAERVVLSP